MEPFRSQPALSDYERFLFLKKAAFHLKLYCALLLIFAVASLLIFQHWGFITATLACPLGFYAAYSNRRWLSLLFLALCVADFLTLFIYGVVVGTSHGNLFVAIEFLFLVAKIWASAYAYRFWQRLPEDPQFFDRFEGSERLELQVGELDSVA